MGVKSWARALKAAIKKTKTKLRMKAHKKTDREDYQKAYESDHGGSPRLTTLPAEIRIQIYELVVRRDTVIDAVVPRIRSYGFSPNLREPPLARVCRQFRHEVLSIFYGQNIFKLTAIYTTPAMQAKAQRTECLLVYWLGCLSTASKASLRHVEICTTLSHQSLLSGQKYSQIYNLADKRVFDGEYFPQQFASSLRLGGWTWVGNVPAVNDWCSHLRVRRCGVGRDGVYHHALIWTA